MTMASRRFLRILIAAIRSSSRTWNDLTRLHRAETLQNVTWRVLYRSLFLANAIIVLVKRSAIYILQHALVRLFLHSVSECPRHVSILL